MIFPSKLNKNNYFEVEAVALNEFMSIFFKKNYNFYKDQNVVSGVDCLFTIKESNEGYEFEAKKLSTFLTSGYYHDIFEILMGNLVKQGKIKSGRYLILT